MTEALFDTATWRFVGCVNAPLSASVVELWRKAYDKGNGHRASSSQSTPSQDAMDNTIRIPSALHDVKPFPCLGIKTIDMVELPQEYQEDMKCFNVQLFISSTREGPPSTVPMKEEKRKCPENETVADPLSSLQLPYLLSP